MFPSIQVFSFVLRSSQSLHICTPTHPQSLQSKYDHFSHDLLISESIPSIISYYICCAYVVACARNIYVGVFVRICTINAYICLRICVHSCMHVCNAHTHSPFPTMETKCFPLMTHNHLEYCSFFLYLWTNSTH